MTTYDVILVRRTPQSATTPILTAIGPIKWTSLTATKECGAAGSLDVACSLDSLDTGVKQSLIDLSASPCELWCYRDATLIHAGPLTNYRIQGRNLQFTSLGLLAYLGYMVRDTALIITATEQATLVGALVTTYQAQTYGNFGIDASSLVSTGITRDLTLLASDLKHLDTVIFEMGARDDGFDLSIDPATRVMVMNYPRQGTDKSATVIIDGRSIGEPQYAQSVGPGQIASDVAVSSSSAVGGNLTSAAADTALRASFGRAMMTASYSDASVQAMLDDNAQRFVDDNSSALHEIAPGLLAVPGFAYTDVDVGDLVTYDYDAGLGRQMFVLRIKTKTVKLDSGTERMTLGFF